MNKKLMAVLLAGATVFGTSAYAGASEAGFDELDLVLFGGGNKTMWEQLVALFQEKYPDVEVKADITDDADARIRTRMLTDDQPDIAVGSKADQFNPDEAIRSGLMMPLNDILENGETYDGRKYADFIDSAMLEDGLYDGNYYKLPYAVSYYNMWYDKTLFTEKGWEDPTTWEDAMTLYGQIAEEGISPWIYQGLYPDYLLGPYLIPALAAEGGYQNYVDCCVNLTPGAWKSEGTLKAVSHLYELAENGYFYEGVTGIDHTQSQIDWLGNEAAYIPCGSWLESEMKDVIPEGFEMTPTLAPLTAEDGTRYLGSNVANFYVPAKANPDAAAAFIGVVLSKEGQQIVAATGRMPLATDITTEEIAPYFTDATLKIKGTSEIENVAFTLNVLSRYYPVLGSAVQSELTNLILMEITPEEFCERVEAVAEELRNDDSVYKYSR